MKFAIITHVPHGLNETGFFAYAPYVREMNIWGEFVDEMIVVAPRGLSEQTAIHIGYSHKNIRLLEIPAMNFQSLKTIFGSFLHFPKTIFAIFKAMKMADHIHLRCPGNIGLLGCLVQILFPKKPKTAKYAGNWDPDAKQPLSYRLQKWILNNTFLTKNMQVLVYGEWAGSSKNIKPFFTATYYEKDKIAIAPKSLWGNIRFLFVGSLAVGKQPMYAVKLLEKISKSVHDATLHLYGDGQERKFLERYCAQNKLSGKVIFHGNQTEAVVRKAYQDSHFIILASKSEGWPKVIAEAMFWGCYPLASAVSCVPFMLDNGHRGLLLEMDLDSDALSVEKILQDQSEYDKKVLRSMSWSREYTLDLFKNQIKALVHP